MVGYLLTMGKASEDGRTWAFSGLLALAVFEYQTKMWDRCGVSFERPLALSLRMVSSRRGLWAVLPHCSATAAPRPDGHGRGASTWQPLG